MLLVIDPVLRLHLGSLWTCWIEFSLQQELDFALLQELQFGHLFGHFWSLFVAKRISGAHLVPLWALTETFFASLIALWHLPGITAGPPFTFCSFLAPLCCP